MAAEKKGIIRLALSHDLYRKFKVYCAMNDMSMTQQTTIVISQFIKDSEKDVKIIKTITT